MLTMCTWSVPIVGSLVLIGLFAGLRVKRSPARPTFVLAGSAILAALLEPMLGYFLKDPLPPAFGWTLPEQHTQVIEFFAQWWPIFLPGVALCFVWRTLPTASRVVLILVAGSFVWVEMQNFTLRYDMTSKTWPLIYAAGFAVVIPEIARRRAWPFRVILAAVLLCSAVSFCYWISYDYRSAVPEEIGHLDGLGQFRLDRRKARILEELSRLPGQTIIPGKMDGSDSVTAVLVAFSHTRAYATWGMISDIIFFANGVSESGRRWAMIDGLYEGKLKEPLYFLRQADIAAVVVYPDDNIEPALVEKLKQQLEPYYTYEDGNFRTTQQLQMDTLSAQPCAGVFVYRPEITKLLGEPKSGGPAP